MARFNLGISKVGILPILRSISTFQKFKFKISNGFGLRRLLNSASRSRCGLIFLSRSLMKFSIASNEPRKGISTSQNPLNVLQTRPTTSPSKSKIEYSSDQSGSGMLLIMSSWIGIFRRSQSMFGKRSPKLNFTGGKVTFRNGNTILGMARQAGS